MCAPRASAVFTNPCMFVNLASRDHRMEESWLTQSLYFLSAKRMNAAEIEKYNATSAGSSANTLVDYKAPVNGLTSTPDEIRFLPPPARSGSNGSVGVSEKSPGAGK